MCKIPKLVHPKHEYAKQLYDNKNINKNLPHRSEKLILKIAMNYSFVYNFELVCMHVLFFFYIIMHTYIQIFGTCYRYVLYKRRQLVNFLCFHLFNYINMKFNNPFENIVQYLKKFFFLLNPFLSFSTFLFTKDRFLGIKKIKNIFLLKSIGCQLLSYSSVCI